MEINAKVYAVADDGALLKQVSDALYGKTFQRHSGYDTLEPCAVLPLTKTWYGFSCRAEPTDGPEEWLGCLEDCARILRKNGAVIVEFRSPDHPDDYLEYAWTTSAGSAGCGGRPAVFGYDRALGNKDISLALDELFAERTARDRERLSRRKERKEAVRREKGDFEITGDGVLKRYRGHDREVVIPGNVKVIGESAFVDLKSVERMLLEDEEYDAPEVEILTIPDSVERIEDYAFAYCLNLTTVHMADSVRELGERAFEGCESLKSVKLSENLEEINDFTFFLCENFTAVTIPKTIRRIGKGAFSGCSLKKILLPEGLAGIGEEAFDRCEFRKVVVPGSVTEIGAGAFPREAKVIRQE